MKKPTVPANSMQSLVGDIRAWAHDLGFDQVGVTDTCLADHEAHFLNWLQAGMHGDMEYMQKHGSKRTQPAQLLPGTLRIISVRMNYLPPQARNPQEVLDDAEIAYVSR